MGAVSFEIIKNSLLFSVVFNSDPFLSNFSFKIPKCTLPRSELFCFTYVGHEKVSKDTTFHAEYKIVNYLQ